MPERAAVLGELLLPDSRAALGVGARASGRAAYVCRATGVGWVEHDPAARPGTADDEACEKALLRAVGADANGLILLFWPYSCDRLQ